MCGVIHVWRHSCVASFFSSFRIVSPSSFLLVLLSWGFNTHTRTRTRTHTHTRERARAEHTHTEMLPAAGTSLPACHTHTHTHVHTHTHTGTGAGARKQLLPVDGTELANLFFLLDMSISVLFAVELGINLFSHRCA